MQTSRSDALLGLLHPAWQTLIAVFLAVVTLVGLWRLAKRGPTRVNNAVFVTGFLVVAVTVIGTLVVSCSPPPAQLPNTDSRTPSRR